MYIYNVHYISSVYGCGVSDENSFDEALSENQATESFVSGYNCDGNDLYKIIDVTGNIKKYDGPSYQGEVKNLCIEFLKNNFDNINVEGNVTCIGK